MDRSSFSLLLSLLVHAVLVWLVWQTPPPPAAPSGPTEVTYVDAKDRPRTARHEQYIDKDPAKPDESVQKEELHDTSSLISNLNRRYKKQMLNRRRGPEVKTPRAGPVQNEPKLQNDHLTTDLAVDPTPNAHDGELELPRFGGAPSRKAPLFAPSSTAMKVPWVDFGDMTVLNSDRNTYFVFYERMGEQVGNRWVNLVREMISRTPRDRLDKMSRQDRLTRVEIVLDKGGDFKSAHFEGSSGFEDLDYTGVEAFRMATPFVNPPQGMAGPDGLIHIHVAFEIIMRPPSF